jgi:pimeloyl-ACP methyl ester carboxylesterase
MRTRLFLRPQSSQDNNSSALMSDAHPNVLWHGAAEPDRDGWDKHRPSATRDSAVERLTACNNAVREDTGALGRSGWERRLDKLWAAERANHEAACSWRRPPGRGDRVSGAAAIGVAESPLFAAGLAYERHGVGPPVVLLHGVGESRTGWHPVLPALASRYDVITLDLPGFGASPPLPSNVAPMAAALADAVERALDELGVGRVHAAGYSLGGRVALQLAVRGRLESVIAIAPDGLGTPLERLHQALALAGRRMRANALAPWAADVAATGAGRSLAFVPDRVRPWLLPAADAHQLLSDMARSPGYFPAVAAGVVDVPTGLHAISCPALIVQGTNDPLVSAQAPRFLTAVPTARLRWLPGLSHVPISDDPASMARLMLDFFAEAAALRLGDDDDHTDASTLNPSRDR